MTRTPDSHRHTAAVCRTEADTRRLTDPAFAVMWGEGVMTRTAANGPSVGGGLGSFSPEGAKIPTAPDETPVLCGCCRCVNEAVEADGGGPFDARLIRMFCCETCGNKRCPHATDHRHACTGSNEPGQQGSRYA